MGLARNVETPAADLAQLAFEASFPIDRILGEE
jgi:hypothetical protein